MTYNWSSNGHRNFITWRTLTNYLHLAVGRKRAVRKSELNFHSPENKRKGKRKRKKERKKEESGKFSLSGSLLSNRRRSI